MSNCCLRDNPTRCICMAFTGERNSEGKFDGQGTYSFADGATYTGE